MSWANFQEDAFNLTDNEVKALSRQVVQEYRKALKSINEELRIVYADILSGVNPKKYFDEMLKADRLKNLLLQIQKDYSGYSRKSGVLTKNSISLSFSNVYYRKAFTTEWLAENVRVGILPKSIIELTTLGTKKAWDEITKSIIKKFGEKLNYVPQKGTLTSLLVGNRNKEILAIQSAITQGFINKQSKNSTMQIIRDIIGKELIKDGKLTLSGAKANALKIIRTETNRAANMGSYAQSKSADAQGIDIERMLASVLDEATRAQSASMDGQTVGVDEPFKYPEGKTALTPGTTGVAKFDINDRETVVDIVNGESPAIRRGRNPATGKNEAFAYKNFDEWAKEHKLTKNKYGEMVG